MTDASGGQDDSRWEAFVTTMLANGHAIEGRSRYSDKSALFTGSREIAHLEAPGVIDLWITRTGWARAKEDYGRDTAVRGGIDTDSAAGVSAETLPAPDRGLGSSGKRPAGSAWDQGEGDAGHDEDQPG